LKSTQRSEQNDPVLDTRFRKEKELEYTGMRRWNKFSNYWGLSFSTLLRGEERIGKKKTSNSKNGFKDPAKKEGIA